MIISRFEILFDIDSSNLMFISRVLVESLCWIYHHLLRFGNPFIWKLLCIFIYRDFGSNFEFHRFFYVYYDGFIALLFILIIFVHINSWTKWKSATFIVTYRCRQYIRVIECYCVVLKCSVRLFVTCVICHASGGTDAGSFSHKHQS